MRSAGDIPPRRERALHLGCLGTGVAALLGYYLRCRAIDLEFAGLVAAAGLDTAAWTPAQLARATQLQQTSNALPGVLWGAALAPVVAAALVWAYQRLLYNELLRGWDEAKARHEEFQRTDLAMLGLDASVDVKARLLQLRKVAYTEVVVPLERYVAVIFLFTIPQIVAVTDMCRDQTNAAIVQGASGDTEAALPCENVAEFVLAWRAVALGVVYFWASEFREEAVHIPGLCRRAWNRLAGTGGPGGARARFPANELDGIALVPTEGEGRRDQPRPDPDQPRTRSTRCPTVPHSPQGSRRGDNSRCCCVGVPPFSFVSVQKNRDFLVSTRHARHLGTSVGPSSSALPPIPLLLLFLLLSWYTTSRSILYTLLN